MSITGQLDELKEEQNESDGQTTSLIESDIDENLNTKREYKEFGTQEKKKVTFGVSSDSEEPSLKFNSNDDTEANNN